ncbi:MAG: hypothetical protein ABIR94_22265 [Rubrivivax sp.]
MNARLLFALLPLYALTACGTYKPQDIRTGQDAAQVAGLMGEPTGRYALPGGASRLEYATGPQGRVTWMVDLNADGKVTSAQQVLNERSFAAVQANYQDMDAQTLRSTLGQPGNVRPGGWQGGQVWSWRYPTNECFWFQVSVLDNGKLRDGGAYGTDPQCDPGDVGGWR